MKIFLFIKIFVFLLNFTKCYILINIKLINSNNKKLINMN